MGMLRCLGKFGEGVTFKDSWNRWDRNWETDLQWMGEGLGSNRVPFGHEWKGLGLGRFLERYKVEGSIARHGNGRRRLGFVFGLYIRYGLISLFVGA